MNSVNSFILYISPFFHGTTPMSRLESCDHRKQTWLVHPFSCDPLLSHYLGTHSCLWFASILSPPARQFIYSCTSTLPLSNLFLKFSFNTYIGSPLINTNEKNQSHEGFCCSISHHCSLSSSNGHISEAYRQATNTYEPLSFTP